MKLRPTTVAKIIKGWTVMFPGQKDPGQLVFLSGQFFEALQNRFTDEGFILAAKIIRDEQEFFPTVAHLVKLQNVVADKLSRKMQIGRKDNLLPEEAGTISDEEAVQNRKRITIITRMLAGKITKQEAESEQRKLTVFTTKGNATKPTKQAQGATNTLSNVQTPATVQSKC